MITLYGIKNCDTVRKARRWLDEHDIDYQFHDVREDGLSRAAVSQWVEELGWQQLINRRSTSWKQLPAHSRDAMDDAAAIDAIVSSPTLFKRPLLDTGKQRFCGFSVADYDTIFSRHNL